MMNPRLKMSHSGCALVRRFQCPLTTVHHLYTDNKKLCYHRPAVQCQSKSCQLLQNSWSPTRLCPLSILVQILDSGDGDEGDPRWISRWTRNWRTNDHERSLCWSPRPSQPQIQPTHQRPQDRATAFDCVDHDVLLQRLEIGLGMSDVVLQWI